MAKRNQVAIEFWEQLFASLAKADDAAIVNPQHDQMQDELRLREGLAQAGWTEEEVQWRISLHKEQEASAPVTSPGVAPHVEFILGRLCDDIEAAMDRLHLDSHARVARGVEPRLGPIASMTNVIMTDEGVVTVSALLFRFCGLVARAFLRTLHLAPFLWESVGYSDSAARIYFRGAPELMRYWFRIFVSFAVFKTHILVPFRPATRHEALVFEQIARAMEIFAVAHEYGHHHLNHGRNFENDPKNEEFEADQFALKMGYEVESSSKTFANPYLASGAGGVILLSALKILEEVRFAIVGERAKSRTHPEVATRIARFDTVALLKPAEFKSLRNFRTVSARVMNVVASELSELVETMPKEVRDQLKALG